MAGEITNEIRGMKFRDSSPRVWTPHLDSLQAIADRLRQVPVTSGKTWYVSDATGDNDNDGVSDDTPFATVTKVLTVLSRGDKVIIMDGTFDEDGLTFDTANTTYVLEKDVALSNSIGTVLTVTGTGIVMIGGKVSQLGQAGIVWPGNEGYMIDTLVTVATRGIEISGLNNKLINVRVEQCTSVTWDIIGERNRFVDCVAEGNSAAVRGFDLSANSSDYNIFKNCSSHRCTTSNFRCIAGADNNVFDNCSSDTEPSDAGTNNVWANFNIGSQITASQSRDQDLKDINDNILTIINERLVVSKNNPTMTSIDEEYRFEFVLIDNDTGPIASASIEPGTYNLDRIRGGVTTSITSGVTFDKTDGRIYTDITFDTATWNPDDTYLLTPQLDTIVVIGGGIYYPALGSWSGLVSDLSNIEAKIDAIASDVDNLFPKNDAVTYHVMTTGDNLNDGSYDSPFLTIYYAIEQLATGGTIIVHPGTYDETASSYGVDIGVANITIIGVGGTKAVTITNTATTNDRCVVRVTEDNIIIKGINLQKGETTSDNANVILIDGCHKTTLEDVEVLVEKANHSALKITGSSTSIYWKNGPQKKSSIYATTTLGTGINFDSASYCIIDDISIAFMTTGVRFSANGDKNFLRRNSEIASCTTGISLESGASNNILDSSIIDCTTKITDLSGNSTNSPHGSVSHIHDELSYVTKYIGKQWYVNVTSGIDTNDGKSPDSPLSTIGAAIVVASAGDRIYITAGTYTEAIDLSKQGLELVCEKGALIVNGGATVVTISANYCRLEGAIILPSSQIGLHINSGMIFNNIEDVMVLSGTTGIEDNGLQTRMNNVRTALSTKGFEMNGTFGEYNHCITQGTSTATTGFDITTNYNTFNNCHSQNNNTAGWTVSGDANSCTNCSSGGTDGTRIDTGTNNTYPEFGEGTNLPINKSIYDIIGSAYIDGGGVWNTDSIGDDFNRLGQYLIDGTAGAEAGSTLPAGKSLIDIVGTEYVDAGGNPDVDTIRNHLQAGLLNGTGTPLPENTSIYDVIVALIASAWKVEDPQTGTIVLTTQNTWYSIFTAYTSTTYVIKGAVSMAFPASQTYELRVTYANSGRSNGPITTYIIGAADLQRTIQILQTEYVDIELRCTTAGAQTVTYDRAFEYATNSTAIAPT